MIIKKEEQLVLDDGTADRAAKHVPSKLSLGQTVEIILPAVGIQLVVAEVLPDVAVVLVGSGLDGSANDPALEVTKLGRGILRDQVELLDRIRSGRVPQKVVRNLVIVHAIKNKVVGLFAVAIDERPATAGGVITIIEAGRIGRDGARREQRQLHIVARGQRQCLIRRGINNGAHCSTVRLKERNLGRDFDRFCYLAHGHLEVDTGCLVKVESEGRMNRGLESLHLRLEFIGSDGNAQEAVNTGVIGLRSPNRPTISFFRGYSRSRERRPTRIHDCSGDCCSYILTPNWIRDAEHREQHQKHKAQPQGLHLSHVHSSDSKPSAKQQLLRLIESLDRQSAPQAPRRGRLGHSYIALFFACQDFFCAL